MGHHSPLAVGSRIRFSARFLGRRLDDTYEVTVLEPGRRFEMRTAQGPFPMTTEYRWEPAGEERCTMTLRNHGEPSGFSKLMAPMMSLAMRRAMTGDLATLKRHIETV